MIYQKYLKRILDFTLSTVGLIILSPVYGILVVAIKADSKGPILFKQKRVGIHKQYFNIYKFRTMSIDTPKDTPKFLRKTSLDELPQIFNIIKGEMSIIGPRPALWNQEDLIAERDQYKANDVRPGLTGLAQISGRDELEIPIKAKLDGQYVKNISFPFDCKMFFKTITSVLKNEGVQEGGTGAMGIEEDLK